jgi:ribonuclease-3
MKLFSFLKPSTQNNRELYAQLKEIVPGKPKDLLIYNSAFTHPAEQRQDLNGCPVNYQRLEFLGDALIGSITAKYLFDQFPKANEGQLTKMRAKIVSRKTLNQAGKDLKLSKLISNKVPVNHYGKNIYGDLFEALTGAIYCDLGYNDCECFLQKHLLNSFANPKRLQNNVVSYKNLLMEACQKEKKALEFKTETTGASEKENFQAEILLDGKPIAKAMASSKKKAEEEAARQFQVEPNSRKS